MIRQELSVLVADTDVPIAEALLELANAESITLSDAGDDALLEPAPGTAPLWRSVRVAALFETQSDLAPVCRALQAALPDSGPVQVRRLDDETLAARAEPIGALTFADRLVVTDADREPSRDDAVCVRLNRGLAFGTGTHPTTRLCLQWLAQQPSVPMRVLDYGCGTGVLALAALALGADQAWAVDIEPQALAATAANAHLNRFEQSLWTGTPDELNALGSVAGRVDLIMANILATSLIDRTAEFRQLLAPGGTVLLSGVLTSQCSAVEAAYARLFTDVRHRIQDGWALIIARVP